MASSPGKRSKRTTRARVGTCRTTSRAAALAARRTRYLYSANRVKYPMVRGRLLKAWREARLKHDPWRHGRPSSAMTTTRRSYQQVRGLGGFVRSSWDEVNEIIAAANVYDQEVRPGSRDWLLADSGDVDGELRCRQPLSEPDRRRLHELLTGTATCRRQARKSGASRPTCRSRRTGTTRPTSSRGAPMSRKRAPGRALLHRSPLQGRETVAVTPDYAEISKLCDLWLHPKQGTDAALAMAMGM